VATEVYPRFTGRQAINKALGLVCCLLHAAFLFGLLFNPEHGRKIIFRNVDSVSTDYLMLSQMIELLKSSNLKIELYTNKLK
jgi:hypothetical protein